MYIKKWNLYVLIFILSQNIMTFTKIQAEETGGINQGAQTSSSQSEFGMIKNYVMGGVFGAKCYASMSTNWESCVMAGLSFLEASMLGDASSDAKDVCASSATANLCKPTKVPDYTIPDFDVDATDGGDGTNAFSDKGDGGLKNNTIPRGRDERKALFQQKLNQLKDLGFEFDPNSNEVKTPKGNFPISAFGSPGAMAAAGMSDAQIANFEKLKAQAQQISDELDKSSGNVVAVGVSGGSGGYNKSNNSLFEKNNDPFAAYLESLKKKGLGNRKPSSVAGMRKVLPNGDAIGVSMDDIFEMVHRRYQKKRKTKIFLEKH